MNAGARAVIERLDDLCGDDDGFRTELIASFLSESDKDLARLRAALDAGDAVAGQALAHLVKGACATMGAEVLAARCGDIEAALRAGARPADLIGMVVVVGSEWEALRSALAVPELLPA